jgi:hypothetical protein
MIYLLILINDVADELLIRLHQDLVNVKALKQLSWEREGTNFRQTEIVHDILVAA